MAKQKPTTPHGIRLQAARKAAAKDLKLDSKDWRAQRFALLMIKHENLQAQFADDGDVDIDQLLRVEQAMAEIRATLPVEIPKVSIVFVNGSETQCPQCDAIFAPPETGDAKCECGHVFIPRSPVETKERKLAAAKAAPPDPDGNSSPSGSVDSGGTEKAPEAKASSSSPAPAARPAPPSPPPPPPISDTMRAWNRHQGYNRSARDGGLIKGPAVPHSDPNLPASAARESYNNDKPVCWTGYMSGTRPYGTAVPDQNPNFNSDGSARSPHKAPY